jgi:ubiquitin-conjugating enzyme E2 J2
MALNHRTALLAKSRLTKEYKMICAEPIDNCVIKPDPLNIFSWHFIVDGISDTLMCSTSTDKDGNKVQIPAKYYGTILFPNDYPMAPPSVFIHTPNGMIIPSESICMSMTSWHPESWHQSWGPRTVVLGLFVFLEDVYNRKESSATAIWDFKIEHVAEYAKKSKLANVKIAEFCRIFPELAEEWKKTEEGTE